MKTLKNRISDSAISEFRASECEPTPGYVLVVRNEPEFERDYPKTLAMLADLEAILLNTVQITLTVDEDGSIKAAMDYVNEDVGAFTA